jgi:putative DNA-invertase from lambdoid prophage Rac
MSVKGWIRVSGNKQDEQNQRHEILEYCNPRKMFIADTDWFSCVVSTRSAVLQEFLTGMLATMQAGDMLIVTELSRLGRQTRDIFNLIFELRARKVGIVCIKERIEITQEESIQNIALIGAFTMVYELERSLIAQRTKEALKAKVAQGVKLGRKPNKQGKTKLDEFAKVIEELAGKGVSITSIAKIIDAKRSTVNYFVKTRGLKAAE